MPSVVAAHLPVLVCRAAAPERLGAGAGRSGAPCATVWGVGAFVWAGARGGGGGARTVLLYIMLIIGVLSGGSGKGLRAGFRGCAEVRVRGARAGAGRRRSAVDDRCCGCAGRRLRGFSARVVCGSVAGEVSARRLVPAGVQDGVRAGRVRVFGGERRGVCGSERSDSRRLLVRCARTCRSRPVCGSAANGDAVPVPFRRVLLGGAPAPEPSAFSAEVREVSGVVRGGVSPGFGGCGRCGTGVFTSLIFHA